MEPHSYNDTTGAGTGVSPMPPTPISRPVLEVPSTGSTGKNSVPTPRVANSSQRKLTGRGRRSSEASPRFHSKHNGADTETTPDRIQWDHRHEWKETKTETHEESKRPASPRSSRTKGRKFTFDEFEDEDDIDDGGQPLPSQKNKPEVTVDVNPQIMENQQQATEPESDAKLQSMYTSCSRYARSACWCCPRKKGNQNIQTSVHEVTDIRTPGSQNGAQSGPTLARKRKFASMLKQRSSFSTGVGLHESGEGQRRDKQQRENNENTCYRKLQKLCKWTSAREFFTLHAVRFVAITAGLAYSVLILFTRHIYGIIHAFFGLLFSMEAYNGARRRDRKVVLYYAVVLVLSAVVSVLVGSTLLNQTTFDCFLTENSETCSSVQFAWGTVAVLMAIGEGSAAIVVFVAWSNMLTRQEIEREKFQRQHGLSSNASK